MNRLPPDSAKSSPNAGGSSGISHLPVSIIEMFRVAKFSSNFLRAVNAAFCACSLAKCAAQGMQQAYCAVMPKSVGKLEEERERIPIEASCYVVASREDSFDIERHMSMSLDDCSGRATTCHCSAACSARSCQGRGAVSHRQLWLFVSLLQAR